MNVCKKAFTLVELLVVITVLAILGTIAYIAIESNIASSRDAARQLDLWQMVNVLETHYVENITLPDPSNSIDITFSWSALAWKQWSFWESVWNVLKVFWNDVPRDPRFKNYYTYSVTSLRNEYQVAAVKETLEEEEWLGELVLLV